MLVNEWFYFNKAIPQKTCNKIKNIGKGRFNPAFVDLHKGTTKEERKTGRKEEFGLNTKVRISDITWTNTQWLIDLIWPYMNIANEQAGWNFDIRSVENIQVAKYAPGGFYEWHKDGGADCLSLYDMPDNKFLHGKARKLSMTIPLNDNYEGGEFQFSSYSEGDHKISTIEDNTSGSVIVFPSFMEHRVTPITKGTRYSLVAWFLGPPFK